MDDLRWVLLLVGVVVVVAIYLSGRFEGEDWARERKQFRDDKLRKSIKKTHRKRPSSTPARFVEKQEPSISSVPEDVSDTPVVDKPPENAPVQQKPSTQNSPAQKTPTQKTPEKDTPSATETRLRSEAEVTAEAKEEMPPVEKISTAVEEVHLAEAEMPESPAKQDANEVIEEKIDADIEDEITEVEIPLDLAVAEAEIHIDDQEQAEKPAQAEMALDIEPLVLSVSVLADDAEGINGLDLKEALEAEGLTYGAMRIFHFYDPEKEDIVDSDDAVFSAANLLEPGYFEPEKMEDMHTPGLMLFCQLPGPIEGEAALELMLDKARGLAVRLHGQMCDDKRNRFTAQAKTLYQDRISAFNRELMLARKKNA